MKYRIIQGPNINFYCITALMVVWSISNHSWCPVFCWFCFCLGCIPLSLWCASINRKLDTKHREYMLKNFGYDPEVQKKFGEK